jgi:dTDP-4-dehydrorhamnose 3,5-epimerase
MQEFDKVTLITGQVHSDPRGSVAFNNSLDISGFCRMYVIGNSTELPIRGWHGHAHEAKIFTCLVGSVEIAGVRIDNWVSPSKELTVEKFELHSETMDAVYVPAGYANAVISKTPGALVQVLSSSTLDESKADDFRYPADYWMI